MDEIKQEEMQNDEKKHVEFIRRVPVKIAIHTGLRNTYNLLKPKLPTTALKKVILKPPYIRASPNLKMIGPADIVNGKTREIIGRLTFHKIKTLEKEASAKVLNFPVTRPICERKIAPKVVVRPKSAKCVMQEYLRVKNIQNREFSIWKNESDKAKYCGVPMATPLPKEYDSENFKLSKNNPKLAARLAQIINFKNPEAKPRETEIDYPDDFPEILRCRNFEPIDPEFLLNSLMEPPEFEVEKIKKEIVENEEDDKIWFRNEEEDVKFDILDKIL